MDPSFLEHEVKKQKISKHLSLFQRDKRGDVRARNGDWNKLKEPEKDRPL